MEAKRSSGGRTGVTGSVAGLCAAWQSRHMARSRPPAWLPGLVEALDAELVPMGSAGVKAVSVLDGSTDAYVHAGGQYEWDSAAPVVVAAAAGLFTSRVDGSKLLYNQPNVSLPDVIVCRPEIADRVLAAVAELGIQ